VTAKTIKDERRILDAITRYHMTLERDPANGIIGLRELALALDHLVAVYLEAEETNREGGFEAPAKAIAYPGLAQRASNAFPELGYCPHPHPRDDPDEQEPAVANAMDDLVYIAGELIEVVWHFEELTPEEAIWHYRFGYQHRWGGRLLRLRYYLHSSWFAA
jgi:hypothetical protein